MLAFVFPGQGSQAMGMLSEYADEVVVRDCFDRASAAIDVDLWALSQQGPEADLNATTNTQPALLAASVALWRLWQQKGGAQPSVLAGHSLGEYSALVAAGVLSLEAAAKLVRLRGSAMQQAVPAGVGAMAVVLNAEEDLINEVCAQVARDEVVSAANLNSAGQIVIAGHATAVERAREELNARGVKRVMPLPVSVPSHCALMKPAAERLAEALAEVELAVPAIPVLHNVDAQTHESADEIRRALVEQLYRPVRWVDCMNEMSARGVDRVAECGPGKVLLGLCKRGMNAAQGFALGTADQMQAAQEQWT
ncbi:MAG: ACP S-malonyltransferase [Xanthomonadales bacterium]|nr:ACP S-malonyltransferase [Xanthomonadales bacterium]